MSSRVEALENRQMLSVNVAVEISGNPKTFLLDNAGQLFDTTDSNNAIFLDGGVNKIVGVQNLNGDGELLVLKSNHQLDAY